MAEFLVVGGGVCGLTLADRLTEAGRSVAVVERESQPGGLARTFQYENAAFDIGPHRFHTTDHQVLDYIDHVLGDDGLIIPRRSLVFFHKHYYNWPIHPTLNLFKLPLRLIFGVATDLLFFLYRKPKPETFEDYILNMYGKTLYNTFFRDYTTKFLGIDPARTHADWAKTGIDRAIIDERLQINTLGELIKSLVVRPKGAETKFRYPKGGIERFAEKLVAQITAGGGTVACNTEVTGLEIRDGRITQVVAGEKTYRPEQVVWTASLPAVLRLAGEQAPQLDYLDLVCYNLITKGSYGPDFQWCYFGSPDLIFSRVSRPEAFDASLVRTGYGGLCVEVTAGLNPDVWDHPEAYRDQVVDGLISVGLLENSKQIENFQIERVPEAYPMYRIGYDQQLAEAMRQIQAIGNLHPAGRTGTFWYNNMDHSIAAAFKLADQLLAK